MVYPTTTQNPSIVTYQGAAVVTTAQLADFYGVSVRQLRQNHHNNRDRFIEGKHCVTLTRKELKAFKHRVENFDLVQIAKNTRHLTLWTRRGAARHAKMLNSDKAWEMFEALEDSYFKPPVALPSRTLPALPLPTVPAIDRKAALAHLIRRLRDHHPTIIYMIALDREAIADELERLH